MITIRDLIMDAEWVEVGPMDEFSLDIDHFCFQYEKVRID